MLRVLDVHRSGESYLALFDQFDDLVIVKGPPGQQSISFFQIKTKGDGFWKVGDLASRPTKAQPPKSIIGKLYHNLATFGDSVSEAAVLSNAPLIAVTADGSKTGMENGLVLFSNLDPADHGKLVAAIEQDFAAPLHAKHAEVLAFERIPLDLESYRKTLKGEIVEFLDENGIHDRVLAAPFYDVLHADLCNRTGDTRVCSSVSELTSRKGLSREGITDLLSRARARSRTVLEWWPVVQAELTAKDYGALASGRLRQRCIEYWSRRSSGSPTALKLSEEIKAAIENHWPMIETESRVTVAAAALVLTDEISVPDSESYDIQAALIVELMDMMS